MADFFDKEEPVVEEQQSETIKVGDKEYSTEDLQRLVGLGEIARESEEKYKTKIDRVWPEFTKKSQAISDYERRIKELEEEKLKQVVQPTQERQQAQLTAEQRQEALRQLDDLLKDSTVIREVARQESQQTSAAKDLIQDVQYIISEAEGEGKPVTTVDNLLGYMQENGVKNPSAAYRLMFENELREIEVKKLESLRQPGMVTTSQSTAGAKQPAPIKIDKSNLKALVQEALGGE